MARNTDRDNRLPLDDDDDGVDYLSYYDKPPTSLQRRFAGFLLAKTGVGDKFPDTKPRNKSLVELQEDAFAEGVRLGTALRMQFQRSPENKRDTAAERAERESAPKPEPKPRGRRPKDDAEPTDETPAPKRRGRPRKADVEPVEETPEPKRRGRPRKNPEPVEEAPAPPKRGRPRKNPEPVTPAADETPKRRPGRPRKNPEADAPPATPPKRRGRPSGENVAPAPTSPGEGARRRPPARRTRGASAGEAKF